MSPRIKLGILTPSSNTSLEPLTQALIANLPHVSVHFSRFRVLKIGLDGDGLDQFRNESIIAAAQLLADAEVDMIGWSGTSSGWLGFEADERLCADIAAATGVPATTEAIVRTCATVGVDCSKERHLRLSKNSAFADIQESVLDGVVGEVAGRKVQAITTFCTNLRAAQRVAYWEEVHGIPVFDTVATVVWEMLRVCKVDMKPLEAWGMLFTKN
ncbi:hypothetical protein Cob_v006997 [Colletotrichum orbiculare MAFF 240422]|uniref:Asp glu racemase n=1 Tax=Colletotrichum orbiculare (strain 104-T / ATCC 96160 / CBS 514.97 / LARS 414 / MAFF 240422) TaxID=1213857 RepID=A0A484FR33_COLOR|nr:hypothetical protein Cob_v006997 [Colletotrichum orbiculare MAFF 240422]